MVAALQVGWKEYYQVMQVKAVGIFFFAVAVARNEILKFPKQFICG